QSVLAVAEAGNLPALQTAQNTLIEQGREWLSAQGFDPTMAEVEVTLDMRYRGQSYELQVPGCRLDDEAALAVCVQAFHKAHERAYGYSRSDRPVQIVNVRVTLRYDDGARHG